MKIQGVNYKIYLSKISIYLNKLEMHNKISDYQLIKFQNLAMKLTIIKENQPTIINNLKLIKIKYKIYQHKITLQEIKLEMLNKILDYQRIPLLN